MKTYSTVDEGGVRTSTAEGILFEKRVRLFLNFFELIERYFVFLRKIFETKKFRKTLQINEP